MLVSDPSITISLRKSSNSVLAKNATCSSSKPSIRSFAWTTSGSIRSSKLQSFQAAQTRRCLSFSDRKSLLRCYHLLPTIITQGSTDSYGKNCPAILPRPGKEPVREGWRLCHLITSLLYDTRQLMAYGAQVYVNWRDEDT